MLSKTYVPKEFESDIYKWWNENGYFKPETLVEKGIIPKDAEPFCITIPPPNVTGVLHLGHAMTIAIEDLMIRYARMQGKKALFIPGCDHAGIATQNVVERELLKKGIRRKELGREKFLEEVWKWKEHSHRIITEQLIKLGLSSDWDRERFTMDDMLSQAVREAFVTLYERGLIYRGNYLVNWCPGRCESAISDLEAEPKEIEGKLYTIRYPIKTDEWNEPKGEWGSGKWAEGAKEFIEVATTRPETLLGDSAVAVPLGGGKFGSFVGKTAILPVLGREIPIIEDQHVDAEFGTGAVKVTPAHDFNDYEIGKRHNLPMYSIFDEKSVLLEEYGGKYAGMDRFEARKAIVEDLKKEGLLVKVEDYTHMVPHCQRCHTIVEPRNSLQWFVKTKPLAKKVIDLIETEGMEFIPPKMKDRLYQWINPETIRDWCISRQLWWGHRIPIWYCNDCDGVTTGREDPTTCSKCGGPNIYQEEDVLDTWFSSGLWPFSTLGWPQETEDFKEFFPNDIRETGYDIIFFWIARELMLSAELTGRLPYKVTYYHGLIRDEHGKKISKSMENIDEYDPLNFIEKFGADTLRYTLVIYSTPGLDTNLDPKNIEGSHKFGNKIWQAVRFILGNLQEDFKYTPPKASDNLTTADRWILYETNKMVERVTDYMNGYNYLEAGREIRRFFWNLFADWYIEISKLRIYEKNYTEIDPRHVLIYTIDRILRVLHPFMPFMTEKLWQALPQEVHDQEALMVARWPKIDKEFLSFDQGELFERFMDTVGMIRRIRGEFNIPYNKDMTVLVSAGPWETGLQSLSTEIKSLTKTKRLEISKTINAPKKSITAVTGDITVYIPMEGLIEIDAEIARIDKELQKLEKQIGSIERKLSSEFAKRAPPELVEKEKNKLEELKVAKSELQGKRAQLSE
ncbi:MAG: valine--tRNA ligase [Methanobacteriota archaeon]|nr:MAG: valine--tRNA ligase [Euryarchaeota archaeon]